MIYQQLFDYETVNGRLQWFTGRFKFLDEWIAMYYSKKARRKLKRYVEFKEFRDYVDSLMPHIKDDL